MAGTDFEEEVLVDYTHSYQRGFPMHNNLTITTTGGGEIPSEEAMLG